MVLKLGMGPNISVVSAFLGAIFLNFAAFKTRGHNRFSNNIIQTAGTSAASTAFMCVVAAAFGYLDKNETVDVHMQISPWQMFTWLTCSGMIGVVFTVLFRRHFVDDPKMIFADGVAAAQTIQVIDAAAETNDVYPEEARQRSVPSDTLHWRPPQSIGYARAWRFYPHFIFRSLTAPGWSGIFLTLAPDCSSD